MDTKNFDVDFIAISHEEPENPFYTGECVHSEVMDNLVRGSCEVDNRMYFDLYNDNDVECESPSILDVSLNKCGVQHVRDECKKFDYSSSIPQKGLFTNSLKNVFHFDYSVLRETHQDNTSRECINYVVSDNMYYSEICDEDCKTNCETVEIIEKYQMNNEISSNKGLWSNSHVVFKIKSSKRYPTKLEKGDIAIIYHDIYDTTIIRSIQYMFDNYDLQNDVCYHPLEVDKGSYKYQCNENNTIVKIYHLDKKCEVESDRESMIYKDYEYVCGPYDIDIGKTKFIGLTLGLVFGGFVGIIVIVIMIIVVYSVCVNQCKKLGDSKKVERALEQVKINESQKVKGVERPKYGK